MNGNAYASVKGRDGASRRVRARDENTGADH
jgi:hypothetical protein